MPKVRTNWSTRLIRLLLLSITGLLVISLGTVVTRDEPRTPQPPSPSEIALSNARADVLSLQKQVNRLAGRLKENRKLESVLSETARTLEHHRSILAPAAAAGSSPTPTHAADHGSLPASSSVPGPSASGAASTPSPGAPAASPNATAASPSRQRADLHSLVEALARSGRAALNDAAGTTAGVAKVLAIAGAEQLTAATALAEAASLPAPELPARTTGQELAGLPGCKPTAPSATNMAGTDRPGPAESRPSPAPASGMQQEAQALRAALTGLQRAIYIYEAAAPRLPGKAASFAESRLQQHRRALEAGTQLLASICGRIPVAEAAYELPAGFRDAPAAALAALEHDLVEMHTDLVGLSDGTVRQWSLGLLPRTSLAAQHWEKP